jgi:PIN domain
MPETLKTNIVFIDTSVFWKSFFAANSPFPELQTLCAKDELRLFTTTITMREIEAQVIEHAKGQYAVLEKLRSKQNALDLMKIKYDRDALKTVTLESVEKALQSKVSNFFESAKATVLPIPDDATPVVLDKFFKREKPFTVEKKGEFRDAFVIETLKRLPDTPNGIYVLSCDTDFVGADERFHILESVEELLSQYNSHSEVTRYVRQSVNKNMGFICEEISKAISKLGFVSYHGRPFDVADFFFDILEVSKTLVFDLRPRQATIQLELVVQFNGDAMLESNESGFAGSFEGFDETKHLQSTFIFWFNNEQPDYFDVTDVSVNNGNPIAIQLS